MKQYPGKTSRMKGYLIGLTACISLCASSSKAQDSTDHNVRWTFVHSPLYFATNTFMVGAERLNVSGANSWMANLGVTLNDADGNDRTGVFLELQRRMYFGMEDGRIKKAGAFFAPYLVSGYVQRDVTRYSYTNDLGYVDYFEYDVNEKIKTFNGGITFGARFVISQRVISDVSVGGGIKYSDVNGHRGKGDLWDFSYTGVTPRVAIQLGIFL
ncbi:MAG: hypothetical protein KDD36_04850 [Flavobacteriales bacterium]|nr:hypothetical protein [Flavobacteriales bacterium]